MLFYIFISLNYKKMNILILIKYLGLLVIWQMPFLNPFIFPNYPF